jgi:EAL domain-containing protein (putative c-di-GMP-specific phosphodiesterase class I)
MDTHDCPLGHERSKATGVLVAVPTPDEIAKRFTAHYQPIVDLNTGAVAGFEALARFLENHDEPRAAATFAPEVHEAATVMTKVIEG